MRVSTGAASDAALDVDADQTLLLPAVKDSDETGSHDDAVSVPPLTRAQLVSLHGGLFLALVIWSVMHIVVGCNPCVLTLYREVVGAVVLFCAATWNGLQVSALKGPVLRHCAVSGLVYALIRLSVVFALHDGGANITAALVPLCPVLTLGLSLALGLETMQAHTRSGVVMLGGLVLCVTCSALMAVVKGPLAFGTPGTGTSAPTSPTSGVLWMIVNTALSAAVQVHNKRILATGLPVIHMLAAISFFCVVCLIPLTSAVAHVPKMWLPTGWLIVACVYSGVFPTAVNNILMSRANKHLGPTVANLWLPLQPVITCALDFVTLGDAVYVGQLLCGLGVNAGLILAIWGKHEQGKVAA